jgi:hypothetical protein
MKQQSVMWNEVTAHYKKLNGRTVYMNLMEETSKVRLLVGTLIPT